MSVGQYLKSQQFQWSTLMALVAMATAILGGLSPWIGGAISGREFAMIAVGALTAVVFRMGEGLADARRNDSGDVKARDVSNGIEPNPNPSIYLQ